MNLQEKLVQKAKEKHGEKTWIQFDFSYFSVITNGSGYYRRFKYQSSSWRPWAIPAYK